MIKDKLELLANHLNLTEPDGTEEPYLLTPDEEAEALTHELQSLKNHAAWKMTDKGLTKMEALKKMSEINFESQVDRDKVLRRANSAKNYDVWQKEQRAKEAERIEAKTTVLRETWTAKRIFNLMSWTSENVYGKKLIVNDETKPLITTICLFLARDERFESQLGLDLNKGLLIRGVSGLGKTHLVKCAAENELNPVQLLSMIEITDEIKRQGEFIVAPKGKIIYLDDVGTEETPVNYYGTKINWFKDFLELYYSKNRPFRNLMISTNINFSEIESKYGFRVRSRAKDMFNVVDVTGKDLRGL